MESTVGNILGYLYKRKKKLVDIVSPNTYKEIDHLVAFEGNEDHIFFYGLIQGSTFFFLGQTENI